MRYDGRAPCRMADRERIGEQSRCRSRTLHAVFVRTRNTDCCNRALNESITKTSQCGDILFIHKTDRHINVHKSGMHTETCHGISASNAALISASKNTHSAKYARHDRNRVAYSGEKSQPATIHRAAKERMPRSDRSVDVVAGDAPFPRLPSGLPRRCSSGRPVTSPRDLRRTWTAVRPAACRASRRAP